MWNCVYRGLRVTLATTIISASPLSFEHSLKKNEERTKQNKTIYLLEGLHWWNHIMTFRHHSVYVTGGTPVHHSSDLCLLYRCLSLVILLALSIGSKYRITRKCCHVEEPRLDARSNATVRRCYWVSEAAGTVRGREGPPSKTTTLPWHIWEVEGTVLSDTLRMAGPHLRVVVRRTLG